MSIPSSFAILGAGIGGLSTAIALQRKGFHVTVYESAPAIRAVGAGLSLSGNAILAYQEIGIGEEVIAAGCRLQVARIRDQQGKLISETTSAELKERFGVLNNFTLHRADLHNLLSGLLRPGTVELGKVAAGVHQDATGVTIRFSDGSEARADYLIAADGIHSVVRKQMLPDSLPRYSGYTCWRAIVDDLPDGLDLNETTETWGSGRRFGVVPVGRNRIYWFATLNAPPLDARMRESRAKDLREYFDGFHFPIPQLLDRTRDDQLIWGDILDLKPIPKFDFDRVVLLGDAAHATTPNLGQGACMAIEDAATLMNALVKYEPREAFRRFSVHRVARTTGIVNQSWRVGRLAQLENDLLRKVRDNAFRMLPKRTTLGQLKDLFEVSFHP